MSLAGGKPVPLNCPKFIFEQGQLRIHYAETLRAWRSNFLAKRKEVQAV
jgi:cyclopropane fatty-acyl-phospholipid synthase-like methyltransferase